MTTSYTQIIEDKPDVTLREFALRCARNVGYFAWQRDQGIEVPPQPYDPVHEKEELAKANADLDRILRRTAVERDKEYDAACVEARQRYDSWVSADATCKARYSAMLAKVTEYKLPSSKYQQLKNFMLSQLEQELKFFSSVEPSPPDLGGAVAWENRQLANARERAKECAERLERCIESKKEAEAWLKTLEDSFSEEAVQ